MRYKDTIKLVKEALHNQSSYTEAEILYMKRALKQAKDGLARKRALKKQKGFGNEQSDGKTGKRNS